MVSEGAETTYFLFYTIIIYIILHLQTPGRWEEVCE